MKILIVSNKLEHIITISNFININISNSLSLLFASDIASCKFILSQHNISVLIIDADMFIADFYTNFLKFVPLIIIDDSNRFKQFECISMHNLNPLKSILQRFISFSSLLEDTKLKILNQLMELGFNIKHNGTKYIMVSILIYKFYYSTNKIEEIYSLIAEKYHTSSNNIKSNILKAINYMYYESDFSKLKEFFSLSEEIRPTPKQVIFTILKNTN